MIRRTPDDRQNGQVDPILIRDAMREAVREALRRHMLLGESVAVAGENGGVKLLGPEEIRNTLEQS